MDAQPVLAADLSQCDREPIHIPGSIQPHGILVALDDADLKVLQVSANAADIFALPPDRICGRLLHELLDAEAMAELRGGTTDLKKLDHTSSFLGAAEIRGQRYDVIGHRRDGVVILELEISNAASAAGFRNLYASVRSFIARLRSVSSVQEVAQLAADEARRITGFDRALTYQFDEEWHGTVIAESRDEAFPSYLGLRFPASDIPAQARRLYTANPFRLIVDASYTPAPLVPTVNAKTGKPLDLTSAHLRSVSPVHVEYLKNMEIVASMSISVFQGDRLWGLIACHDKSPQSLPYEVRTACEFLGQVLSVQLEEKGRNLEVSHRVQLRALQANLLAAMTEEEDFVDGLIRREQDLLTFAGAGGAAIVFGNRLTLLGVTPAEDEVRRLADYLAERGEGEVFSTDCLACVMAEAEAYKERASGLLAVSISKLHRSFLLWFRPEVIETVNWGGDPRKATEPPSGAPRLHPRKSFAAWKETVRNKSAPWRESELEAAVQFRNAVVGIVLRKAEELAALSAELQRSNHELEAFSYSVSHDLRAPFRHIVGYSELLREQIAPQLDVQHQRWVDTIINSAQHAGRLVDNLLSFSQMSRSALTIRPINSAALVREVIDDVQQDVRDRRLTWRVADALPFLSADPNMLRQVWQNLLANAIKYTRLREEAIIEIGCQTTATEHVFFVSDNGVGFDMKYVDKLFGVFQRLHRMEEFEGTGIGLANVRRIIARHGGRTWAKGVLGQGATFYFSLPIQDDSSLASASPRRDKSSRK